MEKRTIIVSSIATVLAVGISTITLTSAQSNSFNHQAFDTAFANNLSIDYTTYCNAKKTTQVQMLPTKEGLDATKLSELTTEINNSECGINKGEKLMENRAEFRDEMKQLVAGFLGTDVDTLTALHDEGKTHEEILAQFGKTEDEFKSFMEANKPERPAGMMGGFGRR